MTDWKESLSEYIRQGEPEKAEKAQAWKAAIGLQDVDGLKTSDYLLATARQNIEGEITLDQAQRQVESYYRASDNRKAVEEGTVEADVVSARITTLLAERSFHFSPASLASVHGFLFKGVFPHAGKYREYDITKNEWVLDGDTVLYSSYGMIRETLEYDFSQEKGFSYSALPMNDAIRHLANFTAGIWQIHPFGEGNTRTTAVFMLKYLQSLGFQADNSLFEKHSWYFRNALVRANYSNLQKGVHADSVFLEHFFENLLAGAHHELKNRYLHVDWAGDQSINAKHLKYQNDTLNCTLEELALLRLLKENPQVTQQKASQSIGKSIATVKRLTVALQEKGLLERVGAKRNGSWRVLADLDGDAQGKRG